MSTGRACLPAKGALASRSLQEELKETMQKTLAETERMRQLLQKAEEEKEEMRKQLAALAAEKAILSSALGGANLPPKPAVCQCLPPANDAPHTCPTLLRCSVRLASQ